VRRLSGHGCGYESLRNEGQPLWPVKIRTVQFTFPSPSPAVAPAQRSYAAPSRWGAIVSGQRAPAPSPYAVRSRSRTTAAHTFGIPLEMTRSPTGRARADLTFRRSYTASPLASTDLSSSVPSPSPLFLPSSLGDSFIMRAVIARDCSGSFCGEGPRRSRPTGAFPCSLSLKGRGGKLRFF